MGRNIILDGQVINEINRGNQAAADTILQLRQDGATLYMAQQSTWELTTNNPLKKEAAANAITLKELRIGQAPPGEASARQDFLAKNSKKSQAVIQDGLSFQPAKNIFDEDVKVATEPYGIGNLRDAAIAAQAYALDFELLSGEKGFNASRQREMDATFASKATASSPARRLTLAPENSRLYQNRTQGKVATDFATGRALLKLPPLQLRELPGGTFEPMFPARGSIVESMNTGTPGLKDHEATQTKMMGAVIAVGVIVSWIDDYCIEKDMKKDASEHETYIRQRQSLDPETGFLLVAIIKVWQPRDAAYSTRMYVSMDVFESYTLASAENQALKNVLPGLPPPTETVSYTYVKMWIPPLKPRPVLTPEQADEKAFGSASWFPRYRLVRHSLETPPDYGEALGTLQGSSMFDILRVLDALPDMQYRQLRDQRIYIREHVNRARMRVAMAAVEAHKSSSSFGFSVFMAERDNAEDLAVLDDYQKNCIKDWVDTGDGAEANAIQGRWEVTMSGVKYEYSYRLSGTVTWRDLNNLGVIGDQGVWSPSSAGIVIKWPKTGTVETFFLPINFMQQRAKSVTKTGTYDMTARRINPNP